MIGTAQRIIEFWTNKIGLAFERDQRKGAKLIERIKIVEQKQIVTIDVEKVSGICGEHTQTIKDGFCSCSCKDFEINKKPCKHLLQLSRSAVWWFAKMEA